MIQLFDPVAPMIWVENQLEFAAVGHNISLRCSTESYPAGLHFWTFQNGSAVSAGTEPTPGFHFHFHLSSIAQVDASSPIRGPTT